MPRFTGRSRRRHASHDRSARNKDELSARAKAGAEKAILEHFQPAADPAPS